MGSTVTYYPVRDFGTIRILCQHNDCKAVFELAPSQVPKVLQKTSGCCPLCAKPFFKPEVASGSDVVTMLARVVAAMNGLADFVSLELPVKIETPADRRDEGTRADSYKHLGGPHIGGA